MKNITDSELLKIVEKWEKEQPINIGIKTAFTDGYRMAENKIKKLTIFDVSGSIITKFDTVAHGYNSKIGVAGNSKEDDLIAEAKRDAFDEAIEIVKQYYR
ncbi:MAG: hypothetical protein OEV44_00150 [Spirochaetota bacterium]|nr:hypothetical protein [Spirochaetota bacterium]